ncbi:hypothetical protein [Jiangella sp. DSM 45060]|uniref:hypothetical protein n=1 Tax=Jiangella sp. DSM 45060 TaxID=1798224 RepID=UPI00087C95F7|nr:hypothetical protein [Jiangella sp. DSM 45060]SDS29237.1 hypothetical protein SAMN04515669_0764 [Jiangella sp. DSM 45060]
MRPRRLISVHDYLWAAVPILLVVFVWMYGGFAFGLGEETCPDRRTADDTSLDVVASNRDYVPVDFTCEYADGTAYRYVPHGAKLAMYGAVLGAAASLVTATVISRRLAREVTPVRGRTVRPPA